MRRSSCRGCGSSDLHTLLDLGEMPLAGGFLVDRDLHIEKRYPLSIHICARCGLVQILDVVDPSVLFTDYSFSSSTIPALVQHFASYARWIVDQFRPSNVLEFGCNDGVLLGALAALGVRAHGVDASPNISELARTRGHDVTTGFFGPALATELLDRIGRVDVVTGSNVFAHNDHPDQLLDAARALLRPRGHLCLEVMYAGDLLDDVQWDTLYHEHLTFYSLTSIRALLSRHGFHVVHAERIPMHGGSLRLVATPDASEHETAELRELMSEEDRRQLARVATWTGFGERARRTIDVVASVLGGLAAHDRIAAYGAAGKATMWLNACGMSYLTCVADSSPLRAGKLMPGTHTPIVLPDHLKDTAPDHIFITAWNYADGIRAKETWFKGIWSVPLPRLMFL